MAAVAKKDELAKGGEEAEEEEEEEGGAWGGGARGRGGRGASLECGRGGEGAGVWGLCAEEGKGGEEEGEDGADGEEGEGGSKQSRGEKKARRALSRLGLKAVPGVKHVVVKRSRQLLFVIDNPEVLKLPGSDTYVVFGAVRVEDASARAQSAAAEGFRMPPMGGLDPELLAKLAESGGPDMARLLEQLQGGKFGAPSLPEGAGAGAAGGAGGAGGAGSASDGAADGAESAEGVNDKDVELVVQQTGKSRDRAIRALKASGGDIVTAIMELSDGGAE
jgi:nascent polypeptide-associated complex subunit alpha